MQLKAPDVFHVFEQLARTGLRAAVLLEAELDDPARAAEVADAIRKLEHEADAEARALYGQLPSQIMLPIGPVSVRRLVSALDDIVDAIEEVAARVDIYNVRLVPAAARELGRVLTLACREVVGGVSALRTFRDVEPVMAACRAIGERERDADRLLRSSLATLFRAERDQFEVLKWSELFLRIEGATDRCDDAANVIEGIVLEEI